MQYNQLHPFKKKSLQRYKHTRVDLDTDSEDESNKGSAKIVKGTKTKPGFLSFEKILIIGLVEKLHF